jgi:hypothetical protein
MAEVIVIAGVSITVPMILKGTGMALKAAYDIYQSFDDASERQKQIEVCLARAKDILECVSTHLDRSSRRENADYDPYISRTFTTRTNLSGDP